MFKDLLRLASNLSRKPDEPLPLDDRRKGGLWHTDSYEFEDRQEWRCIRLIGVDSTELGSGSAFVAARPRRSNMGILRDFCHKNR